MKLDIAITGVGVTAPLGHTAADLFEALCAGQNAIGPVTSFDASPFPCGQAATVTGFKAREWVKQRKNLKLMTPAVRYGVAGVKRALADAALEGIDPERLGMFVGNGAAFGETRDLVPALEAGFAGGTEFSSQRFGEAQKLVNPLWLIKGLSNNVLGFASAEIDARGFNQNYCNSAVGGLQAIGEGAWGLMEGRADAIIAGGADSAVNPAHFTGFGRLRLMLEGDDPEGVRPFDRRAAGFVPGEGAAFFVLERVEDARARGAQIHGRIVAYKDACAGDALLAGDPLITEHSLRAAVAQAGWDKIDLFIAHGSGTAFDKQELAALRQAFGDEAPPITSAKAQIGHTVAASGPLSVAIGLEAGRQGKIPPIPFSDQPLDDAVGVSTEVREAQIRRVLIHAAGVGGQTTLLALEIDA